MSNINVPEGRISSRHTPRPSRIADELLSRIREGGYPVGSRMPSERQLTEEFNVSRPVIREALSMLTTLGVIEVQAGRGTFVVDTHSAREPELPPGGLIDVVNVREVLEIGALRLAQRNARDELRDDVGRALAALTEAVANRLPTEALDRELHRTIIAASGSSMLLQLWDGMERQIAETIRVSPHGRIMSRAILADHEVLARGIAEGGLDEAIAACTRLYDEHRRFLRALLGV
ncbi:FadR/GntR family transcriptional regulator [Microbispora siamensis]|uniref:GntR family transcriptional regulator n=1 Tax=Microbispora siamensis TaxID=564413 RepID=A0ABQ4GRS1_9ACTN|nr:GntR family transcriptional regulator [Microbispora siamensis]GIH64129.1 GntR family transcriptional regulator [Microbispora siamensis]